jgi:hypothetical protein
MGQVEQYKASGTLTTNWRLLVFINEPLEIEPL